MSNAPTLVVCMTEATHKHLSEIPPYEAEAYMDRVCPDGWPENANVVWDNDVPPGKVYIRDTEEQDA